MADDLATGATVDFRAVFEASPRPLLLMAADAPKFTMLAINRAHAQAFNTTPQALQGLGVLEVFGATPEPAIVGFMEAIRISLERVMASRSTDQMSVRPYAVQSPDGDSVERYWTATNSPVLGPGGEVVQIVSAVQDVTGEVLERRGDEARQLLMREVDHRARNALTVVQTFVRLTVAEDIEAFRRVLDGRVEALARAQTSLAARRWEGASLHDVIHAELSSLWEPGRYSLAGPHVLLQAEHVQAMSMAIHELATNASKYGALSKKGGRLTIRWMRDSLGRLDLEWREEGGPAVKQPKREGFGSRLISQLARQLGGKIVCDWRPEGLCVALTFGPEG